MTSPVDLSSRFFFFQPHGEFLLNRFAPALFLVAGEILKLNLNRFFRFPVLHVHQELARFSVGFNFQALIRPVAGVIVTPSAMM